MQAWLLTCCVVLVGECWVQQHLDGRLGSWGEGARQAPGQNADAVGRGVAGAHVVPAGQMVLPIRGVPKQDCCAQGMHTGTA